MVAFLNDYCLELPILFDQNDKIIGVYDNTHDLLNGWSAAGSGSYVAIWRVNRNYVIEKFKACPPDEVELKKLIWIFE